MVSKLHRGPDKTRHAQENRNEAYKAWSGAPRGPDKAQFEASITVPRLNLTSLGFSFFIFGASRLIPRGLPPPRTPLFFPGGPPPGNSDCRGHVKRNSPAKEGQDKGFLYQRPYRTTERNQGVALPVCWANKLDLPPSRGAAECE